MLQPFMGPWKELLQIGVCPESVISLKVNLFLTSVLDCNLPTSSALSKGLWAFAPQSLRLGTGQPQRRKWVTVP